MIRLKLHLSKVKTILEDFMKPFPSFLNAERSVQRLSAIKFCTLIANATTRHNCSVTRIHSRFHVESFLSWVAPPQSVEQLEYTYLTAHITQNMLIDALLFICKQSDVFNHCSKRNIKVFVSFAPSPSSDSVILPLKTLKKLRTLLL